MKEFFYMDSPIGVLSLEFEDEYVTAIKVVPDGERGDSVITPFTMSVKSELNDYFAGSTKELAIPFVMEGTVFQVLVWEELLRIPYGSVVTYGEVAARMGMPGACRTVGMACNRNPLLIVVPCHRVVGAGGKLTGYAAGVERKKFLLELEKCPPREG